MSNFWFDYLKDVIENHLIATELENIENIPKEFIGRSVIVKKAKRIDVECVVRRYLAGSAWKEYSETGSVGGIKLPGGLKESAELPETIFTPSTKERSGKHDMSITFNETVSRVSLPVAQKLRKISLKIFEKARRYAENRGVIIADAKFEFGFYNEDIILIDEVLTPDSSRFWDKQNYAPGISQKNFDKQYVRDYLISIGWRKLSDLPELPSDIVQKTREKYLEAEKRICFS